MSAYERIVTNLESRGIMPQRAPSLKPMRAAMARLGLGIDPSKVILIAGPNGKESTAVDRQH